MIAIGRVASGASRRRKVETFMSKVMKSITLLLSEADWEDIKSGGINVIAVNQAIVIHLMPQKLLEPDEEKKGDEEHGSRRRGR